MKILADKAKKKYKYYCDRCNKEISFEDNTLKQIHVKYKTKTSKKVCDLCDRCYKSFIRGVFRK